VNNPIIVILCDQLLSGLIEASLKSIGIKAEVLVLEPIRESPDRLEMQIKNFSEKVIFDEFYVGDPPEWFIKQNNHECDYNLLVKDNSFRGGSRKKGGKTKYQRN
jgi:hypothetical protein